MKKIFVVIIAAFLIVAIVPGINSRIITKKTQKSLNQLVEIKINVYKGLFGREVITKEIPLSQALLLQKTLKNIQNRDILLEEKINMYLQTLRNYNIISSDLSLKEMETLFERQRPLLKTVAEYYLHQYKDRLSKKDIGINMNAVALTFWSVDPDSLDSGVIVGIPPFVTYIPLPSIWLGAYFPGEGIFYSTGLLGVQSGEGNLLIIGFVGISVVLLLPIPLSVENPVGLGFSAFIIAA